MYKAILGLSQEVKILEIWYALVDVLEIVILRVICVQIKIATIRLLAGEQQCNGYKCMLEGLEKALSSI